MTILTNENDLVYRLNKRAEIRRQISTRKSVQEGSPDRISDLLEEAAREIERLRMSIVSINSDVMGGTPVFTGTRVPIAVLFENLADGMTLDEILDSYPSIERERAIAALKHARLLLEQMG